MKMKRLLALLLTVCLLMTLAACTGDGEGGTTTTAGGGDTATTTTVDSNDPIDDPVGGETTTDPNATTMTVTDKDGNVVTTTTKKGQTTTTRPSKTLVGGSTGTIATGAGGTVTIGAPITVKEGTTPLEKGLNFGGETFTYAYYGSSWSEKHSGWFKDFEKLYNCKMDVRGTPSDEYTAALASAMASGEPYDLVFLHGFDYPSQIIANVMMPLDDYITTADLWEEGSATKGGFSYSLMEATSLNGHIYAAAGTYLNTPVCLYYNKKIFSDAGYDGADDPLALYKAGKWTWEKVYEILSNVQDPAKGLYGMNTISPYYDHYFLNSYGTDLAKLTSAGKMVQNLSDPSLYKAFEMLQKFSYGEHRVTDPANPFEKGSEQFLNGTTAMWLYNVGAWSTLTEPMAEKVYSAFGTKATQVSNIGFVPVPTTTEDYPVWYWLAYGVGNGTDENGRKFALAFAKYDSTVNQGMTFTTDMPAEMQKISRALMDADNLIAPYGGFKSSAGDLAGTQASISSKIATRGQNVTVTLKAYEKVVQTIIDTALKG